jgi:hypothetical protein
MAWALDWRVAETRPGFERGWLQVVASFGACSSKSQECELGTWCSLILYTSDASPQGRPPRYGPCATGPTGPVAAGILRTRPNTKIPVGSGRTHLKYLRTLNVMRGGPAFPFSVHRILDNTLRLIDESARILVPSFVMERPRCRQTRGSLRTRPSKSKGAAKQRLKEPESRFDLLDVDIADPIPEALSLPAGPRGCWFLRLPTR